MKERNITAKQISESTGIKSSSFTGWKKGDYEPSYGSIVKIASYLKVSPEFLQDGFEKQKEKSPADEAEDSIDDFTFALSGEVHELTEGEREDVLNFVKFVKAQRKLKERREEGD
jgi:transcriptional regulator with XRE-family HTH domain